MDTIEAEFIAQIFSGHSALQFFICYIFFLVGAIQEVDRCHCRSTEDFLW